MPTRALARAMVSAWANKSAHSVRVGMIGFGLAGAGLTVGTITGIIAAVEADDLETRCTSPAGCPQADIDDATAIAHVSTTSI